MATPTLAGLESGASELAFLLPNDDDRFLVSISQHIYTNAHMTESQKISYRHQYGLSLQLCLLVATSP